jgi:hypothetical protein
MRLAPALTLAALLGSASALPAQDELDLPLPLRVTRAVPYRDGREASAFVGPFRCDGYGNVFFIPYAGPSRSGSQEAIVRLAADGRTRSVVHAADSVPGFTDLGATALDADGHLYALVSATADGEHRQYVVSFDDRGRLRSRVPLDGRRVDASGLAVFGSGESVLLLGRRPESDRPRLAILGLEDDSWRTLALPEPLDPLALDGSWLLQAQPGPDGRVYVTQRRQGGGLAYAISAAGQVSGPIELRSPRRHAKLSQVHPSGGRLAAVFQDPSGEGRSHFWVTVHDLASGHPLETYGPLPLVWCYQANEGTSDLFTLFGARRGQKQVFQATAAP